MRRQLAVAAIVMLVSRGAHAEDWTANWGVAGNDIQELVTVSSPWGGGTCASCHGVGHGYLATFFPPMPGSGLTTPGIDIPENLCWNLQGSAMTTDGTSTPIYTAYEMICDSDSGGHRSMPITTPGPCSDDDRRARTALRGWLTAMCTGHWPSAAPPPAPMPTLRVVKAWTGVQYSPNGCDPMTYPGCQYRNTYISDIMTKCQSGCHQPSTVSGSPPSDFISDRKFPTWLNFGGPGAALMGGYQTMLMNSYYYPGHSKAEAAIRRVKDGTMPIWPNGSDAPLTTSEPFRLDSLEVGAIQWWINHGYRYSWDGTTGLP